MSGKNPLIVCLVKCKSREINSMPTTPTLRSRWLQRLRREGVVLLNIYYKKFLNVCFLSVFIIAMVYFCYHTPSAFNRHNSLIPSKILPHTPMYNLLMEHFLVCICVCLPGLRVLAELWLSWASSGWGLSVLAGLPRADDTRALTKRQK